MVVSYKSIFLHFQELQLCLKAFKTQVFKEVVLIIELNYFYCWKAHLRIWHIGLILVATTIHLTVLIT